MDLPVPGRNLNQHSLTSFTSTTAKVTLESITLAAAQVRSRETTIEASIIPGAY